MDATPEGSRIVRIPRDVAAIERERRHWWMPMSTSRYFYEMNTSEHAEGQYWIGRRAHKRMSIEEDNHG